MQVKQYLKGVASAVFTPVVKALSSAFPAYGAGFTMLSGLRFSTAIDGMNAYNNKIFYSAQNILVRKLTETPIIFSKKKTGAKQKYEKFYSKAISNEQRAYIKANSLDEVPDHELSALFDAPNKYQSGIEMMEDFWHNYGFGDGYLWFEGLNELSRNTKPTAIHSLNRSRVEIVESQDKFDRIAYYNYTTWDGYVVQIPKEQILHLKHWNPNLGDLRGLGVDVISAPDISLNNANNLAQGAAFTNGGRGTAFSSKVDLNNDGKPIGKLPAEEIKKIKESVERDMAGAINNRRQVFTNGELVVTPYGDTLAEMELTESEKSNWLNIFAICGIPWALSPVASQSSENSVIVGHKALVTNIIISELRKFDQKLTQMVQRWWPGLVAVHDLTEFTELAPDLKLMKEVYGSPEIRVDERRNIFGLDAIGGDIGNAILVPSGLIKIEDIINDEFNDTPGANDPNAPNSL